MIVNSRKSHLRVAANPLLVIFLILNATVVHADWLSPVKNLFGGSGDEIVIWEAPGQYVKVVDQGWFQGHKRAPKNSHPAKLNQREIAITLASLQVLTEENKAGESIPLFTTNEVTLLAGKLAEAFDKAQPDQDVVFAVVDQHGGFAPNNSRSTAGRVFVLDGKLNIILGDVLQPADKNPDSQNISYYNSPHRAGKRWEPVDFSTQIMTGPGIAYQHDKKRTREDWVAIDVPTVTAAYKGPPIQIAVPAKVESMPPDDAAKLLEERRQMLEEMARMKKELQEKESGVVNNAVPAGVAQQIPGGGTAASGVTDDSLERRLTILKSLHEKKLITSEEYEAKRKEILGDL